MHAHTPPIPEGVPLAVRLFGEFELWVCGRRLPANPWGRGATLRLFQILLGERGRAFAQDELVERLFPDRAADKALKNLHGRVSELRRTLEPGLRRGGQSRYVQRLEGGRYRFSAEAPCWLDHEAFHALAQAGRRREAAGCEDEAARCYERALALYRGPFLAGAPYDEWALPQRAHWQHRCEEVLAAAGRLHERRGRFREALVCCARALELNPALEAAARRRMRCHARLGQRQAALSAFFACRAALARLEAEPVPETVRLLEEIRGGTGPGVARGEREALLKGRFFLSQQTPAATAAALRQFRTALDRAPHSAAAHAGLADALVQEVILYRAPTAGHVRCARRHAERALELDPASAAAHAALARMLMNFEWRCTEAEALLQRALALDPAFTPAHERLAHLWAVRGDVRAALRHVRCGLRIDPLAVGLHLAAARAWHIAGAPEGVEAACAHALELDPRAARAHHYLGLACETREAWAAAVTHLRRAVALSAGGPGELAALGHALGRSGRRAEAERVLGRLRVAADCIVSPYHLALVHAGLGAVRRARARLEEARRTRDWPLVFAAVEPRLAGVRG